MDAIRQRFSVPFSYPIIFTRHALDAENPVLAQVLKQGTAAPRLLAVVDRGVAEAHVEVETALTEYVERHGLDLAATLLLPGGEEVKNTQRFLDRIHEAIHRHGLCRRSFLVAIGGGSVLDVAGYAAATAHRGLHLVRLPTTTLAQCDGGVGVKNGLNAFGKKNFLGAFAPPAAVINDAAFLSTLSLRDWRCGIAEGVKVALIRDAEFFAWIESHQGELARRDLGAMEALVRRSARLHANHISTGGDPFERGSARPLDFGHWSAHKLEQLSGFRLRHGEAVAVGVALDTAYSWVAGLLPREGMERVHEVLESLGFALYLPELERPDLFMGLREFQEHIGGELTLTLLTAVGWGIEVHSVDLDLYAEAVRILAERKRTCGRTGSR